MSNGFSIQTRRHTFIRIWLNQNSYYKTSHRIDWSKLAKVIGQQLKVASLLNGSNIQTRRQALIRIWLNQDCYYKTSHRFDIISHRAGKGSSRCFILYLLSYYRCCTKKGDITKPSEFKSVFEVLKGNTKMKSWEKKTEKRKGKRERQ